MPAIHTAQMKSGTEREEWYTPVKYIHSVVKVLGNIDLDPCSCATANQSVQAAKYFTREQNALSIDWPRISTMFCNPPYSAGIISEFVERIIMHSVTGGFQRAIILINNVSETKYWQRLALHAEAICMTDHRISFVNSEGKIISQNTRGQTFFYLVGAGSGERGAGSGERGA